MADFGSQLFGTPAQMQADADALNGDFDRIAADVENSAALDSFKIAWRSFYTEWRKFYEDLDWLDRLWSMTQDQIDRYRVQLNDWQARFRQLGGTVAGAGVEAPPDKPSLADALGIKWIVLAAVGLLAVAIVVRK